MPDPMTETTAPMPKYKRDGWDRECVICGCKWMEEATTECPQCDMKDDSIGPNHDEAWEEINTLRSILRAIRARHQGDFDQPDLVAFGPLSYTCADVLAMIAKVEIDRED